QDPTTRPIQVALTPAGQQVFPYIRPNAAITVTLPTRADGQHPLIHLASVVSPAMTTPLLETAQGQTVASITRHEDGRESLTLTVPNHPNILHSMLLSYGLIDWVAHGALLGERHVNLGIQVDDLLAQGAI